MNTVANTWTLPRRGATRTVAVTITTTKPAGVREFALMGRLAEVVEGYIAEEGTGG